MNQFELNGITRVWLEMAVAEEHVLRAAGTEPAALNALIYQTATGRLQLRGHCVGSWLRYPTKGDLVGLITPPIQTHVLHLSFYVDRSAR